MFICYLVVTADKFPLTIWFDIDCKAGILKIGLEIIDGGLDNSSSCVEITEEIRLAWVCNFIKRNNALFFVSN